ncbi:MAG: glycosyltransferase family 2 protein [Pikeienuella sp.]
MRDLTVSVIILTRRRPKAFRALLDALKLQRRRKFDVVVVGAEATASEQGVPEELIPRITYVQCIDANISKGRNLGVSHATGDIIAFIDDDAAPEGDWLDELIRPFAEADVGAVGGFVRGRNGVDLQWRGALVDRYGAHSEITSKDLRSPMLGARDGERFVSTVGVNCALRRDALVAVGGFDENFHYFLDESDMCIRLRQAGWRTVLAPRAEVFHAYAPSAERRGNRAPRDLFQIGASRSYFAHVHGDADEYHQREVDFREQQEQRLRKFVQLGRLSRRQARAIEARLDSGLAEGTARWRAGRKIGHSLNPKAAPGRAVPYIPDGAPERLRVALVVTTGHRRHIYHAAAVLVDAGCEVSLFDFDFSARRLRVGFYHGMWRHHGGILGRDSIDSPQPPPRRCLRVRSELNRVFNRRDFEVAIHPDQEKYRLGVLSLTPLGGPLKGFVAEPFRPGAGREVAMKL